MCIRDSMHPLIQQADAALREIILAESVIAEKHLIAGIHRVKRLLTPRAILIMLVHTQAKRLGGHLINTVEQAVRTPERPAFHQRVTGWQQACVPYFQRLPGSRDMQGNITPRCV